MNGKTEKLFKKALNKQKAKKVSDAEELYKKILRIDKTHLDANYMLGTLYAESGKFDAAEKYLKIAETINPHSPYIQNNLGNLYRQAQQFDNAINHYQKALSAKPDMVEACNNLGVAYKQQGNIDKAMDMYQQAILVNPGFIDARYNLGNLYWDIDDREHALPCFLKVLETNPGHARSHDKLGTYYMENNDHDKAMAHFKSYLGLDDKDECGVELKIAYLNKALEDQTLPLKIPDQLVRETYEKKAHSWDTDINREKMEFLGPQHIKEAFEKIYTQSHDLDILDLGCGSGLCGEFLQNHSQTLIGVDLSQHMLAKAREKDIYNTLVNNDIVQYLNSSDTMFDVITGSGILIFFGDLEVLLNTIKLKLKPGGRFIFTLYKSKENNIEVRENIHFAHSADYVQNTAHKYGLKPELISDITHEFDYGKPQPGLIVVLKAD